MDPRIDTETTRAQQEVECLVAHLMNGQTPTFRKSAHFFSALQCLKQLPQAYASLDASRPWLVFWTVHAIDLLGCLPQTMHMTSIAPFLSQCQTPSGGFGGGPGQMAHLAPTYAAVMALVSYGDEDSLGVVDRHAMEQFLLHMKQPNGAFTMHQDGEADVRATYCALAVASVLDIMTEELTCHVFEWVMACQTYEGGFGGEPGNEAHGGYSFCAVASIALLGRLADANPHRILVSSCS